MSRILVLAAFLSVYCFAQTLPPGVQKKASMGGITEYDFPNGLSVLLYPEQSNPKVTINMTYLVGSRHEGYGETGMAHLLEHMDFIETTNGRQIKKEIVDRGASWNGSTNSRPHELLRNGHRQRREPEVGAWPGSRPHGQCEVHQGSCSTRK